MKTAAVIGSGFGGLALAIRLQSAGVQTTLIEQRDKPGGRAYVFEDKGFTFDAGPTVITDPSCLEELWGLSGRKLADYVELMPVTPFYRLMWEDGYVFDYSNDDETLFAQIKTKNPKDVAGYKRFLEYSENVFREGYEKLGHEAIRTTTRRCSRRSRPRTRRTSPGTSASSNTPRTYSAKAMKSWGTRRSSTSAR